MYHFIESFGRLCTRNGSQNQVLWINGRLQSRQNPHNSNGSVNQEAQPFLNSLLSNGHATGTNETYTSQTLVKSVHNSDESIFDKNTSLEQNEGSRIMIQMSAASNSKTPVVKTSPANANNTRTGSTGNIPNSDSSVARNTEAPTIKAKTMATGKMV